MLSFVVFLILFLILKHFMAKKPQQKEEMLRGTFPLPPGPKPWPIVGCVPQMVRNRPTFRWILKLMGEMGTEIACIRLGRSIHVIPVTSPELSCEFLKKQDEVFASRPRFMSGRLLSGGFLSAALSPNGDQWKKMRRIVKSEVVSPMRHSWLHEKRNEEADHLVYSVYNQSCRNSNSTGGVVNVRRIARFYCNNVMRKILFSKRFFHEGLLQQGGGLGVEEVEEYDDAIFTCLEHLNAFDISDYMPCLEIFDFYGHKKIILKSLNLVRKYHDSEIDERIQQWKKGFRVKEEDILDVLIMLKDEHGKSVLTPEEIKAQIFELMLAGMDNPSNAIEWAIAEMLNQPELLQRATSELDNVVGRDRLVQEYDLPQLNYITACAKEALRLHPVTAFNVPHVSMADTTVGGYFIPKGSHVLLSRPGIGRNARVWEEPLKYKPERHLIGGGGGSSRVVLSDHELRMVSFSTGRRGCLGVTLGSTMICMLLARLLQGFTWSVPPNLEKIDLSESVNALYLAQPLHAVAKPRLIETLYQANVSLNAKHRLT